MSSYEMDLYNDGLSDDVSVTPLPPNPIAAARKNTAHWKREVHREAKLLVALGFHVLPVARLGKGFAASGFNANSATSNPKKVDEWFHPETGRFAGFNLGIACGCSLLVVDADRHGGPDGVAEWNELLAANGQPAKHPLARTPNDGEHHFFKWSPPFHKKSTKRSKESGLEVLGGEKDRLKAFVLAYPSVVKDRGGSYKQYTWGLHPQDCVPLPAAPTWLTEAFTNGGERSSARSERPDRGNEEVGPESSYAPVPLKELEAALRHIKPWELEYENGDAKNGSPSYLAVLQAIHSEHPDSVGHDLAVRWAKGELHNFENDRYKDGEVQKRWKGFDQLGNAQGRITFGTIKMAAMVNGWLPPGRDPVDWMTKELQRTRNGTIKPTLANCIACIRNLPLTLQFDEFTQRVYVDGEPVGDSDITKIRVLIENTFGAAFGKDMADDAITAIAQLNAFDALQDYVSALPAHDENDHIGEMCELMGVSTQIERAFIKRQLIGAIARALQPGVKDDTAVVLLGPQGGGKSQLIEALAPVAAWFDDTISGKLSNKDELAKMCGKWMVELAELASLNRSNSETSKQFMSTKVDRFRAPYGRKVQDYPRRCSVWGSTNDPQHLSDETGNRRFWTVTCPTPMAAVRWLKSGKRENVWAQALALYKAGAKWWLNRDEESLQRELAEQHRKKGYIEQELEHWWQEATGPFAIADPHGDSKPDSDGLYRRHFVQVGDVRKELQTMKIPPALSKVADGLKAIGFVPHPTPTGKGKATTYQFKDNGVRRTAPRGFVSPQLDAELETLPHAERARRILQELERYENGCGM